MLDATYNVGNFSYMFFVVLFFIQMLATLLVIRQFLQNVKEVSQPHLYQKVQQGELSLKSVWLIIQYALRRLVQKYAFPQRLSKTPGDPLELGARKKCLNGGCGVPEEEEEGAFSEEDESEEESIMDCGLKLKRVSFLEKGEKQAEGCLLSQQEDEMSFLQEGSPTLMEKGSDPASVFQLGDDEEDEKELGVDLQELEEQEPAVKLRPRRRRKRMTVEPEISKEGEDDEEYERKQKRESWMNPPDDHYPTKLTQAEVESCMKKYEVRHCFYVWPYYD